MERKNRDHFQELVSLAYDVAEQGSAWDPLLDKIREAFQCEKSMLYALDSSRKLPLLYAAVGHSDHWRDQFFARFAWENPIYDGLRKEPDGYVRQPRATPDYAMSAFRHEYVFPQKVASSIVGVVTRYRNAPLILTAQRDKVDYTEDQLDMFRYLIGHVRRAFRLGLRLGPVSGSHSALESVLRESPQATVLLDEQGRIAYLNPAAIVLLATRCGLAIASSRLVATAPEEVPALQRLVQACLHRDHRATSGSLTLRPRNGDEPLTLHLHPLNVGRERISAGEGRVAAIAFLHRRQWQDPPSEAVLSERYGLTPDEAQVALRLRAGRLIAEIATDLGVAQDAVREHLQHILWKTGAHGQEDLVEVLSNKEAARRNE
jgi:DNA-binding CsgD family transcriptional regulator/PAS domain-containing protein